MQQVLVLNASYEPLNVCSVRRAHVLVFKGKAEVILAKQRNGPTGTIELVFRGSCLRFENLAKHVS